MLQSRPSCRVWAQRTQTRTTLVQVAAKVLFHKTSSNCSKSILTSIALCMVVASLWLAQANWVALTHPMLPQMATIRLSSLAVILWTTLHRQVRWAAPKTRLCREEVTLIKCLWLLRMTTAFMYNGCSAMLIETVSKLRTRCSKIWNAPQVLLTLELEELYRTLLKAWLAQSTTERIEGCSASMSCQVTGSVATIAQVRLSMEII